MSSDVILAKTSHVENCRLSVGGDYTKISEQRGMIPWEPNAVIICHNLFNLIENYQHSSFLIWQHWHPFHLKAESSCIGVH